MRQLAKTQILSLTPWREPSGVVMGALTGLLILLFLFYGHHLV